MRKLSGMKLRQYCRRLSTHALSFGGRVAAAANEAFRHRLVCGPEMLDLRQFHTAVGRRIETMAADLARREKRLAREVARAEALRQERQRQLAELRERLQGVVKTLTGAYGKEPIAAVLRLIWPLPADPRALLQQAKRFLAALVEADLALPEPRGGVVIDLPVLVHSFDQPIDYLGAVLGALSECDSIVGLRRCERDAVAEELQQEAGRAERFFLAFCELAGEARLAERLRKSLRGSS